MKKLVYGVLVSTIALTSLNADNLDVALEIARADRVKSIVKKENIISDYTQKYILETGDTTPTVSEITSHFSLPSDFWKNARKGAISVSFKPYSMVLTNSFPSYATSSTTVKNAYNNISARSGMFKMVGAKIELMYSPTTRRFLDNTTKAIATGKVQVKTTPPTNHTKLWYKPNGYGAFEVFFYYTGKWHHIGKYGNEKDSVTFPNIINKSNITTVQCISGMNGFIEDGTKMLQYQCTAENKWIKFKSLVPPKEVIKIVEKPIYITPPDDPANNDGNWEIDNIQFSTIADIKSRYGYRGEAWSDFVTGEDNGFYLRVRNLTTRRDDHPLNSRIRWNKLTNKFTGGNTSFSHYGWRMYSSTSGWMIFQNRNGKYAGFKINRRSTAQHPNFEYADHGYSIRANASRREICFNFGERECVKYNIDWKAVPQ